jgi:hypothetical protein
LKFLNTNLVWFLPTNNFLHAFFQLLSSRMHKINYVYKPMKTQEMPDLGDETIFGRCSGSRAGRWTRGLRYGHRRRWTSFSSTFVLNIIYVATRVFVLIFVYTKSKIYLFILKSIFSKLIVRVCMCVCKTEQNEIIQFWARKIEDEAKRWLQFFQMFHVVVSRNNTKKKGKDTNEKCRKEY